MTDDVWRWGFFLVFISFGLSLDLIARRLKELNEILKKGRES